MTPCQATVAIPDCIIDDYDLPPLAGWLYVVIVRHVKRAGNDAFPSVTRLAKLTNMSKASVLRYTKVLEDKQLITVQRTESPAGEPQVNHYQLANIGIVVAESEQGGISQQPPVVSVSNEVVAESEHNQLKDIDTVPKEGTVSQPARKPRKHNLPNPPLDAAKSADNVALAAIIKAWVDGLPVKPVTDVYQNKSIRAIALALVRAGYGAADVTRYMAAQYQDKFWRDRYMRLDHVADYLPAWLKQNPSDPFAELFSRLKFVEADRSIYGGVESS